MYHFSTLKTMAGDISVTLEPKLRGAISQKTINIHGQEKLEFQIKNCYLLCFVSCIFRLSDLGRVENTRYSSISFMLLVDKKRICEWAIVKSWLVTDPASPNRGQGASCLALQSFHLLNRPWENLLLNKPTVKYWFWKRLYEYFQ
jgi:hypothetical protein